MQCDKIFLPSFSALLQVKHVSSQGTCESEQRSRYVRNITKILFPYVEFSFTLALSIHTYRVAQQSIVLLKNNGFLPVNISSYTSVAIIGPCADNTGCNTGLLPSIIIHALCIIIHDILCVTQYKCNHHL